MNGNWRMEDWQGSWGRVGLLMVIVIIILGLLISGDD